MDGTSATEKFQFLTVTPEQLMEAPELAPNLTPTEMFTLPADWVKEYQISALRRRFHELVDRIPTVRKFADEQGVTDIKSYDDGVLMLFPHSVYKSYPLSVLEKNQFDRLTQWFDNLTVYDLSGLNTSKCEGIDDWIDLLDAETDIRVKHSSGTTGKLSFIPRSLRETVSSMRSWIRYFDGFGDEPNRQGLTDMANTPIILGGYRKGAMAMPRACENFVRYIYGGNEDMVIASNPGRLSADMLSLGGRITAAESKGDRGRLQISPALMARRAEFMKEQAEAPERLRNFFKDVITRLAGKRVIMVSTLPPLLDILIEAQKDGLSGIFSPESRALFGGGNKGKLFPDGFREDIAKLFGFPFPREGYGSSEGTAIANTGKCLHDHHHMPINVIPFLLDPRSGAPYPRTGTQTGRFAFFDLCAQDSWGGFITGDEVTMTWDDPCPCGRVGSYVHSSIRRYSEKEGGDDRINCAGAHEMHDKALDFLTQGIV